MSKTRAANGGASRSVGECAPSNKSVSNAGRHFINDMCKCAVLSNAEASRSAAIVRGHVRAHGAISRLLHRLERTGSRHARDDAPMTSAIRSGADQETRTRIGAVALHLMVLQGTSANMCQVAARIYNIALSWKASSVGLCRKTKTSTTKTASVATIAPATLNFGAKNNRQGVVSLTC